MALRGAHRGARFAGGFIYQHRSSASWGDDPRAAIASWQRPRQAGQSSVEPHSRAKLWAELPCGSQAARNQNWAVSVEPLRAVVLLKPWETTSLIASK